MKKMIFVLLCVLCIASFSFGKNNTSQKKFKVPVNNDTKDVHVQIYGQILKETVRPDADEDQQGDQTNQWSYAWDAAPRPGAGGGTVVVELKRDRKGSKWDFKYWLTTDGSIAWPEGDETGTLGSMYTVTHGDSDVELFFDNPTALDISITNVSLTVITDTALYDLDSWDTATGTIYNFSDELLSAGSTVSWNPLEANWVSAGENDWLLVKADFDGNQYVLGEHVNIPEPATVMLLGLGSVAMLRRRRCD